MYTNLHENKKRTSAPFPFLPKSAFKTKSTKKEREKMQQEIKTEKEKKQRHQ